MGRKKILITVCLTILTLAIAIPSKVGLRGNANASDPDPMSVEEYLTLIDTLTEVDRDCLLPCWWGMILGEVELETFSSWLANKFVSETEQSQQLISEFESTASASQRSFTYEHDQVQITLARPTNNHFSLAFHLADYYFIFQVDIFAQQDSIAHVDLRYNEGIIRNADFPPIESKDHLSPQSLFNIYGAPSSVLLQEGGVNRSIIMVYDDDRMFVNYWWQPQRLFTEDGDRLLFCFDLNAIQLINIHAFSSDRYGEKAFEEALSSETTRVQHISDATNLTIHDFVELFEGDTIPCIETPKEIWFPE